MNIKYGMDRVEAEAEEGVKCCKLLFDDRPSVAFAGAELQAQTSVWKAEAEAKAEAKAKADAAAADSRSL